MKFVLLILLRFYRSAISPYLGNNCRFHPTCSVYAMQAIEQYGSIKGTWLALKRIVKCHPWHPGGIDEVP
jgi:putative membrane protein insertion efficiency factor